MSNNPHHCATCNVAGVCDSVVPFQPERENAFAVYWKCPGCGERSLVVSPLGPWRVPAPGMCLQCGREGLVDGQPCPDCGILLAEVLSPVVAGWTDEELLKAAREEFARGTCRRGLTLVNHVLQRSPQSGEAWSIKGQFFQHLGFQRALKAAMQEAVRLDRAKGAVPDQAVGKRWWQFWK
jgi:hypothetical protein